MPPAKKKPSTKVVKKKTGSSTRSRSAASKRKAAPKKKRAPAKKKATASKSAPKPRSWRRWLLWEGLTWGSGLAVGLVIAGGFLWSRAVGDVQTYLADPPRTWPSVIYSAPIEPVPGQAATVPWLAGELLAAGYEKVPQVTEEGQFSLSGGTFEIWTAPVDIPGARDVEEQLATVVVSSGHISRAEPAGVRLRPTALAVLGDLEGRRTEVHLSQLSPWVEPALLAMEDARFREHKGIDPFGILRALAHNLFFSSGDLHGGSTLTQQLAKNLFLSQDRTMKRKVREAFFAAALESELSKDELLELYLGEVYLGQVGGVPLHGVEAASRAWFGVSAHNLTLGEAATIAGVISAPNRYSPARHPERAQERRDLVLDRMVETGALTAAQADAARAEALVVDGELPGAVRRAPWAVDVAVDAAEQRVGEGALSVSGYQVHTTIQPLWQRAAEQAVSAGMAELDADYPKAAGAQVALVAVRIEDGAVVALVGGRDYADSPFNRATSAWRQAGSTVKPLTLLAAFDADSSLHPLSRIVDEPISRRVDGKAWNPGNYDGAYKGELSLREAIEGSRNIPAVLLAERVGASELQRFYRDAGLSRATNLPSAALGAFAATPWEMAGAYTVFAGQGRVASPWLVQGIADERGDQVLAMDASFDDIASTRAAALATDVLSGVVERGTGARAARYGVEGPAGGKTGTTDDYRDAWFVGFTPELAVAVWVGNDRGAGVGLSGSRAALPTWARFVQASGTLHGEFPEPEGLVREAVCLESHLLARKDCPHTYEELLPEGADVDKCDVHGSPLVEVGRGFRGLFGRKKRDKDRIEDEESEE